MTRNMTGAANEAAVDALFAQFNAAREVAKLLPHEPAVFREKVVEALASCELALMRFAMELRVGGQDDVSLEDRQD